VTPSIAKSHPSAKCQQAARRAYHPPKHADRFSGDGAGGDKSPIKRPFLEAGELLPLVAYGLYSLPQNGMPSGLLRLVGKLRGKSGSVEIPIEKLPMIVRFQNIDAPASMEELDPRAFGAQVHSELHSQASLPSIS
jgi:hypothetical protein